MSISKRMRALFLLGSAGVAFSSSGVALAQDQEVDGDSVSVSTDTSTATAENQDNTIVVTATRRATALQDTAAAVAAFDEAALEQKSLETIEDIGLVDTSLQVSFYQSEAQVFIRGIGTPITIGGTDGATAIYRDGVFLSRAAASIPGFFDVGSVEVLKGPQGTLYGRNATAGSIIINSKAPSDTFTGEFRGLYGNFDRYELFGALSGPITEDVLFRVAGQINKRDGFAQAIRPSEDPAAPITSDVENKDETFLRGALEFRFTDNFTATLSGDYYTADDAANVFYRVAPSFFFTQPEVNPGINFVFLENAAEGNLSEIRSRDNFFSDTPFFNTPEHWGTSLKLEWDIGDYNITAISGYRETRPENLTEFDFSDVFESTQFRSEDQWQFTQELLITSPQADRFSWIAGASFFREDNELRNEYLTRSVPELFGILGLPTLPIDPCCTFELNGNLDTTAFSVFADTKLNITDTLSVTAGLRYSNEERGGDNLLETVGLDNAAIQAAFGFTDEEFTEFLLVQGLTNIFEFEDERFTAFTPSFGLEWQARDNVFLYAKATRGFKAGGFNIGGTVNEPFDQEFVWSFEGGVRSDLLDDTLRLNGTIFYYDYTDLQVQTVANNSIVVDNAANATIFGIEGEFAYSRIENLNIDGSIAYLDTEYEDFAILDPARPALGVLDLSGNTLQKAPEVQFAFGADYTFVIGEIGELTMRGDWSFQSRIFLSQFNLDEFAQDSYHWLKARATFQPYAADWRVAAFIDNITDELVVTNAVYNGAVVGQRGIGNFAPPRTYGIEFAIEF